jgi:biotin carboxyl carrier protein
MELIVQSPGTGPEQRVKVEPVDGGYSVEIDGRSYRVGLVAQSQVPGGHGRQSLLIDGRQHEVVVAAIEDGAYRVSSRGFSGTVGVTDPLTHLARASQGGGRARGKQVVKAYMPGRVSAILASEGDALQAGQGVVVLEAMKMENEIRVENDGTLVKLHVTAGQAVEAGERLFEVE